jgi:hypothetical protein
VAFDFSPSYNFHVDQLRFDSTLRGVRSRLRWVGAVTAPAKLLEEALRADAPAVGSAENGRFVAVHLRRRGYKHFCDSGLDFYQRMRFGVKVTQEMCWPSPETVALEALSAANAVGTDLVFVATDDPDEEGDDVAALRAAGLRVQLAHTAFAATPRGRPELGPELMPLVEQAVCASADHFIGNMASTFSFAIAQERDVRTMSRERLSFWNAGSAAEIGEWVSSQGTDSSSDVDEDEDGAALPGPQDVEVKREL